ncbi:hypothetical protein [Brevibacterium sp. SMBL_HHYL_HB1]|uniref:hypothetical protein n=1 Tax=Brevibacterium sp. SMBL_HHYL_HB1 TaxID=2777556 RepID=UPI001BAB0614|nr:hypothetical protein [Brevibacterium sp. SMBL_HHYL_HB1]
MAFEPDKWVDGEEGGTPITADELNRIEAAGAEKASQGPKGDKGDPGSDGLSAFEVAKSEGFEGTVTEWLASLKGDKGDPGADGKDGAKGDKGDPGADGFGTEKQYNDLVSRLEALEEAAAG